jgi:small subunit ribosomal protein S9
MTDTAPAATTPPAVEAPIPASIPDVGNVKNPFFWGTGRRKTAVARVRIRPGSGEVRINDRELSDFFKVEEHRGTVRQPLNVTETAKTVDVFVNVCGGGITGQAGAVALGIARALVKASAQLEPKLRAANLLTRDSRKVERKKYGQAGARRRFQYSKR